MQTKNTPATVLRYTPALEIDYLCFRAQAHDESPDAICAFKAKDLPQFNASLEDGTQRRVYVARVGHDIVGHIVFKLDRDLSTLKLISLYVLKDHRHKLTGTRLYAKLKTFATEVSASTITHRARFDNTIVQAFFSKFQHCDAVPDIEHDGVVHYQMLASA